MVSIRRQGRRAGQPKAATAAWTPHSTAALVAALGVRAVPLLAERDATAHGRRLLALWCEVAGL